MLVLGNELQVAFYNKLVNTLFSKKHKVFLFLSLDLVSSQIHVIEGELSHL